MNICTIVAKNYLAHARTLSASFREHHPDGECFVLVIDEVEGFVDAAQEDFTLLRPSQIGLDSWDTMRGAYDVLELSTAVKPWLLRYLLREHDDGTGVAYMDPDIRVTSRMVELEASLLQHSTVLTPHVTQGMPRDGKKPSETDILLAGVYNLGFIGLSRSQPADELLDWWSERLLTDCHVAPDKGLFVDQRWVDFVPGLVADLDIFRDTSYNVAYWNLPERTLSTDGNGGYLVNGRPLRFFHFSGYSPDARETLSKHQTRVEIPADPVLRELCHAYADALEANGFQDVRDFPYEHDVLQSGMRLSKLMRTLYREGVERSEVGPSLFSPAGEADLLAWLNEPAPAAPALTRYLHAIWEDRPDLQRVYPDPGGADHEGFVGWCAVHGREGFALTSALLAHHPLEDVDLAPPAGAKPVLPSRAAAGTSPAFGVNVAGYLRSELGIGEIARQLVSGLDAADVPTLTIGLHAPSSRQGHGYVAGARNPFPINLICVNADGLPAFAEDAGREFFEGKYNIGVWWWETGAFPDRYAGSFDLVDEVWVGSRFIADALSVVAPVPVVHVPMSLEFRAAEPLPKGTLGLPDAYTFLFSYDYNSVLARKNPLGLIEAYESAFAEGDGAALVLKSINGDRNPVDHRQVQEAAAGRSDIVLLDQYLDPQDKDRLMASCDCYVSLHRSEGFGLTMAEAMSLGKPVIATGYSGNTDFMAADNSFLVDYELVPVGAGADPYPPEDVWAEPDLEQAAQLMRRVREHPEEATERAARGAAALHAAHAPAEAGQILRRRLEQISARVPAPPSQATPEHVEHLRRLLTRGGTPGAPSRFGKAGAAVRKLSLRAMKPYTAYQVEVNRALAKDAEHRELEARRSTTAIEDHIAEHAASTLAELRRQRAELGRTQDALARTASKLRAGLAPLDRIQAELRALPYMSSEVMRTFDAGPAGRVFGFTQGAAGEDGDAYREFEDLFRGSEPFIAGRQRRYLDIVDGLTPVVDAGCGRGEFLDVLRDAGAQDVVGVDLDAGMVARCQAKGHTDTVHGDAVAYLEGREDASLGLVFSAQVVEHLPPEVLSAFLEVVFRKLRPDGLLVFETVNPHSVAALKAFWVDVTHQHPLFPEAMLALARIAGFSSAYVFHPNGTGDIEVDRYTTGEYAVVARR